MGQIAIGTGGEILLITIANSFFARIAGQEEGLPLCCVHVSAEDFPESFLEFPPNVDFIELLFRHCVSVRPTVPSLTHHFGASTAPLSAVASVAENKGSVRQQTRLTEALFEQPIGVIQWRATGGMLKLLEVRKAAFRSGRRTI
jgi:hypothetical protein